MRRREKEITDESTLESIILASLVCRLALSDGNQPYIVPLCFGYQDKTLYFHSALEGKKIDIIKHNQNVCFEFDLVLVRAGSFFLYYGFENAGLWRF